MRLSTLCTLPLIAALAAAPSTMPAQVNVGITLSARLGPEVGVYAYSPDRFGDWRRNYRRWTPVTLYAYNNHFYRHNVRGARAVTVYTYRNQFFLPPDDNGWVNYDKRYDYHRRPQPGDVNYVRPWENGGVSVGVNLGPEISLFAYSAGTYGDWRRDYNRWTPVTVYESNGHYYQHEGNGARPVMIYRYRDEYFLPPDDNGWVGYDKRYDYHHAPNSDDRSHGHGRGNGRGRGGAPR